MVLTKVGYKNRGTSERYGGEKARDDAKGKRECHFDEMEYCLKNEGRPRQVETNGLLRDRNLSSKSAPLYKIIVILASQECGKDLISGLMRQQLPSFHMKRLMMEVMRLTKSFC